MTHRIAAFIHAKLEKIASILAGSSALVLESPILYKIITAIILGAAGALGGHLYKIIVDRFKKK